MGANLASHWWIIVSLTGLVVVVVAVVIGVVVSRSARRRGPICPDPSAHAGQGSQQGWNQQQHG